MIPKPGRTSLIWHHIDQCLYKLSSQNYLENFLISTHQFKFRNKHSTIDQILRKTRIIEKSFENKICSTTIFLDVDGWMV